MMRVLITGAHSFIGGAARERFRAGGRRYRQRWRACAAMRGARSTFSRYDCVVHAAGLAHCARAGAWRTRHTIRSTHRLTAALAACAQGRRRAAVHLPIEHHRLWRGFPRRRAPGDRSRRAARAGGRLWQEQARRRSRPARAGGRSLLRDGPCARRWSTGAAARATTTRWRGLARALPVFPQFDNRRSALYVGNLAELICRAALERRAGTFHPRDGDACSTSELGAV